MTKKKGVIYFLLALIFFIIILGFYCFIDNIPTDSGNISGILTSISGGLAGVYAITFSIILIGVQMASKFGIRVSRFIFTKITYAYMGFFIFSIIFPLIVLKKPDELMTNVSIVLAFICLAVLPFYFYYITGTFDPLAILEKLKIQFSKELKLRLDAKICRNVKFPESLNNIDNLIMLTLNEKDFDTFKQGLSYFHRISIYLELLIFQYKREYFYHNNPIKERIYQDLCSIKSELGKRIREVRTALRSDTRASRSILSSLVCCIIELIHLLKICEEKKLFSIKKMIIQSIANLLLRIKTDFIIFSGYSDNDFLKGEACLQLRRINIEVAKKNQGEILNLILDEIILDSLKSISNSDRVDKEEMLNRLLVEVWILGALINRWCKDVYSLKVLIKIIKFFKCLGDHTIEITFDKSQKIVDLEMPELSENTRNLKLLVTS